MLSWLTHQALFFFLSYIFFLCLVKIDSAVDVIGTFLPGNDIRPGSTLFVSIFLLKPQVISVPLRYSVPSCCND